MLSFDQMILEEVLISTKDQSMRLIHHRSILRVIHPNILPSYNSKSMELRKVIVRFYLFQSRTLLIIGRYLSINK